MNKLTEPTEEEVKNGWTAASLTAYLSERKAGQANAVFSPREIKSVVQNNRYNPHRWRT